MSACDVTFGRLLRQYRVAARLSQERLAERAGLSARTVSDVERGRNRSPRPPSLSLLARALGLSGAERERFERMGREEYWIRREGTGPGRAAPPPDGPATGEPAAWQW